jgi:anti-anti-sigma factor
LAIVGELDMRTTGQLVERLAEQRANGATDLIVDLTKLAFMDSSGLKALIDLHYRSRAEGWRLRMIPPQCDSAAMVLRVTGADKALPFTEATSP